MKIAKELKSGRLKIESTVCRRLLESWDKKFISQHAKQIVDEERLEAWQEFLRKYREDKAIEAWQNMSFLEEKCMDELFITRAAARNLLANSDLSNISVHWLKKGSHRLVLDLETQSVSSDWC